MLSDVCADFITTLMEGETNHKTAVKQLTADVERYSREPWDYDSGEIPMLREACAAVLSTPAGATASRATWLGRLVNLVVIAEQIRAHHDTSPTGNASLARFRYGDRGFVLPEA